METDMKAISVRTYATKEGISLGTVYRRLWEGRVHAIKRDGRWLIALNADSVGGPEQRDNLDASASTQAIERDTHPVSVTA